MRRFPDWLRKERTPGAATYTSQVLADNRLHTVCESARCPNRLECFGHKTAAFMILGDVCTRRCGFCAIPAGRAVGVDEDEPKRVAAAASALGLRHVVVTSVARDDLTDGGAAQFFETITAIRQALPEATVEVLTPDFKGDERAVERVCDARPDIYNHNVETVERLTPLVRSPHASFRRSLGLLAYVKRSHLDIVTKSGMMLGLGEKEDEVLQTLEELRGHRCDVVTIGQYLQPTPAKRGVDEFVHPDMFQFYENAARRLGFLEVYSGPYVRSSYHAKEVSARVLST